MADHTQVVSAARFYIDVPDLFGRIPFSELGGINSKVSSQEYIYNDDKGNTVHTKQYGKTEPPTVTFKRGLDLAGTQALMGWHLSARDGHPGSRVAADLYVQDASGSEDVQIVYHLEGAWCSELNVTNMKAGDNSIAMLEVKITCERIWIENTTAAV